MSLVERALEKARANSPSGSTAKEAAAPKPRRDEGSTIEKAPLFPRVAVSPQLHITEQMLESSGLRAPPKMLRQQTAEYRHIKRQLIATMGESKSDFRQIIMVTSALAGDGKTHSATNLALSLAMEPDFTVLLIDADVAKPRLSRMWGLEERPGLMDALAHHDKNPESLVLSTSIEGLSLLPAGLNHPNATELFASARMHDVVRALSRPANRIIVVDALPLLLATEARALLPFGGQVVVVVRAEVTPRAAVRQSLELIGERANVNLLLNGTEQDGFGRGRYSGYNYTYTYGKASESSKEE